MKLKHIAAALAMVAAGSANAAIATGGNGSLVMIAYDKVGGATTFNNVAGVFDLGITLDDLIGSTGNGTSVSATALQSKNLSWNFNSNTFKVGGVASNAYGVNDWTAAWNTLLANTDAADLSFVVTAFDTVGIGAGKRSIVTGKAGSAASFNTTQASGLQQIAGGAQFNDIFTPIANKGTIGSAANGAYTFTPADGATTRANGYAMAGDGFGNEWRTFNVLQGETLASGTTALYVVDGAAKKIQLGATTAGKGVVALNVATGTLSYSVSAVPEPSSYAMMIAGLAVAGAIARRRRSA